MDSSRRSAVALIRLSSSITAVLVALSFSAPRAAAQEGPLTPWVGEMGITETVEQIMARELALNPELLDQPLRAAEREHPAVDRSHLQQNPLSPSSTQWPLPTTQQAAQQAQRVSTGGSGQHGGGGPNSPQTIGTSFLGINSNESGYIPPDSTGSVGPTQILVCANGRIKVFSKTGALGGLNVTTDSFFNSVRNASGTSDPQVRYDRTSGRWFVTACNVSTPNRILIAVSSGSTITNAASFTFFFFQQDLVLPLGNTNQFADYPKIGVDANAVVIGANMFSGSFVGTSAWVVKKSSITSGGPIVATAFRSISSGGGPFAPTGVDNDDPTATESYIAGVSNTSFGVIVLRRISNPGGSPTISGNLSISVPTTSNPLGQAALGTTGTLDSIDDRLFDAMLSKNRITGVTTLWSAHNIAVNSSGVASGGNRNATRWYQLGNISGTPNLVQSGTLFDNAASNFKGFWMGGVAQSGQGHMALGCSYASAVDHAGCAAAGRLSSDTLGTTLAATLAVVSATNYGGSGSQRWGDYANVSVDPTDDQTMWSFTEYCSSTNTWGVRVIKLIAPPPALPISCSPSSVNAGSTNFNVVVTGQSTSGSGFYDTEPGFNRITVVSTSIDITVNSVVFTNPTTITVNIDVSPSAAGGPTDFFVINPDGQQIGSSTGILTIGGGSPGTSFCAGDDTDPLQTFCPCGNTGVLGHGCNNSGGTGGSLLTSSGTSNPDTVVLDATGELSTSLSIFLQGNAITNPAALFGDGIRCAGGSLKRLYTKNAVSGQVTAPTGGDPSITSRSAALGDTITPGSTRYYQVYYRDPNLAFCAPPNGDSWNVSNGQSILWP